MDDPNVFYDPVSGSKGGGSAVLLPPALDSNGNPLDVSGVPLSPNLHTGAGGASGGGSATVD